MKKRYIFIVITIILAIVIQVLSVNITPALKKIADKEINRFCQMVINNTPFPVTLDHQERGHFGLGLSIAREIMDAHHGSLTVSDTPGGGSTFTLILNNYRKKP